MNTKTEPAPGFMDRSHPEYRRDQAELEGQAAAAASLELIATAKLIDAFREVRRKRPSDRAWVQQWPGLGSAKVWSKVLRGLTDGIDCEKRLTHYKGVLAALRANIEDRGREDLYADLYADLSHAEVASLATLRLLHHHGKDRLIIIEGTSGSGKTSILNLLKDGEVSGAYHGTEADDTWSTTRNACHALLTMLGHGSVNQPIPHEKQARLNLLIEAIRGKGRILIAIDEAHHCTGPVLNLFKTILNRTDAMIILAGMDTLFQKLRAAHSEEAKQLYHNRLFARIALTTPAPEDVRLFLARRLHCTHQGEVWKAGTVRRICTTSTHLGMWSFVRKTVDNMIDLGCTGEDADDASLLTAAEEAKTNA